MPNIIEIQQLQHSFNKENQTLRGIDLTVPQGSIYGFLGANGAGKSTTLKLILGLLKKQKGEILIFNQPIEKNRIQILQCVGSFIESPSFYENLTASENLKLLQKIYQCPTKNIDEVLQLVGLAHTQEKLVKNFSLGMKQRLGIAIAYLHLPELLILDEPTNGLDPNGIIEMRELLLKINKERNTTILISSHILSEIEKLVSHLGIIHQGKMLFEGTLNTLLAEQQTSQFLTLHTSDDEKVVKLLIRHFQLFMKDGKINIPIKVQTEVSEIIEILVKNQIKILNINTQNSDLENIFMNLVNQ